MKAFYGEPTLKQAFIDKLERHRQLDQIIQGKYNLGDKGCFFGCSVGGNYPEKLERYFAIPGQVGKCIEYVFERLPHPKFLTWPREAVEAIPVGADPSLVWPKMAIWMLTDIRKFLKRPQSIEANEGVVALYQRVANGEIVTKAEWASATSAAYAAYATSAPHEAPVASAVAYAASATSAANVVAYAADAAHAAYVAYVASVAARKQFRTNFQSKLTELLQAAPVTNTADVVETEVTAWQEQFKLDSKLMVK